MKYATEVLELLAAFPGREFRLAGIVRYVSGGRSMPLKDRRSVRKAVLRVLSALEGAGAVNKRPAKARGAGANYSWRESETRAA